MKILITGGAGFIGSHLTDRYIKAGHKVIVVDNMSKGKASNLNTDAVLYQEDIRSSALESIFEKERPDIVSHHAAQIDVRKSVLNPQEDLSINGLGLINVLECCKDNKVKKIIYASSAGTVYGEMSGQTSEMTETKPLSPYGITKLLGENYLRFYNKTFGLNYTVLRYSNVFGPRQDSKGEAGVVDIFITNMLRQKPIIIYGTGEQTREYTYVDDIADANLKALTKGDKQIINISTEFPVSVKELYYALNTRTNYKYKSDPVYKPARPGELKHCALKCQKARIWLDWSAKTSLEEGLDRTITYKTQELYKPTKAL